MTAQEIVKSAIATSTFYNVPSKAFSLVDKHEAMNKELRKAVKRKLIQRGYSFGITGKLKLGKKIKNFFKHIGVSFKRTLKKIGGLRWMKQLSDK